MNLPKWKQFLFGQVGRKFDKMAESYGVHYHFIFVESNSQQMQEVADIFSQLEIKPSIDTVYPFEEVNAALDKVANGRSRGKTVLSFEKNRRSHDLYHKQNQYITVAGQQIAYVNWARR